MRRSQILISLALAMLLSGSADGLPSGTPTSRADISSAIAPGRIESGWEMQSSAKIAEGGEAISRPGYSGAGWYHIARPETVLAGLVENGVYPDPTIGRNLRQIPGSSYRIGTNFSNVEMPEDSPFRLSWWYRVEFPLPAGNPDDRTWLYLDGVNYRANVWMNGKRIATSAEIAGAYVMHELDVSAAARLGETNALALEVFPPRAKDLAITFVDWNPMPPDKLMGLWRGVRVRRTGPVTIRHPQVISRLDLPSMNQAHLTITADLVNGSDTGTGGTLEGWIGDVRVGQSVYIRPHEEQHVVFAPQSISALTLNNPHVWWPYQMGSPELYELKLEFIKFPTLGPVPEDIPSRLSDTQSVRFGISEISSELTPAGHRLFRVNGRKLLVRGAAWTPDILERHSRERLQADFNYVRDMNLNTVRLEGKMDEDNFFDLADEMGILVLPGWCCCDAWQKSATWDAENRRVAEASLSSQILRLRNHPSVLAWMNGSDEAPAPDVEQMYLDIEKKLDWPKPILSAASNRRTEASGPTGVKMEGPYDYVPPVYWYSDTKHGGAFGFATEISQGPAIPEIESLRRFLPADKLWPVNDDWDFHSGGGEFKNIQRFTTDLAARYGASGSLEDFVWKSQAAAYEGERAMFEAYGRNRFKSTGVIHWMLNNAWPSLIWNLYDFYLRPHAGYFGTKKACEPVHAQFSYDDGSIVVVNNTAEPLQGLRVSAEVFNLDLSSRFKKEAALDVPADGVVSAFTLPRLDGLTTTYFLRLRLEDSGGKLLSRNFYWLSTKPDQLDWAASTWYRTPLASAGDMRALGSISSAEVEGSAHFTNSYSGGKPQGIASVTVKNTGKTLAMLVRLQVTRGKDDEEVLPVLWQENYFELFPGETRTIQAVYPQMELPTKDLHLKVTGWNVNRAR